MRFRKLILIAVCLAPFAAAYGKADTADEKNAIRVMTFNVRLNLESDGVNAWPNRASKVAAVIRFHETDLVGLQEALIGQLEDLGRTLPYFSRCGVGRDDGKNGGEFSAILYRSSRFTLEECKTFWLSETPEIPGRKGWDAAYPRIVTYAKFRDRISRKEFYHFNTHFDHVGETARRESAKLVLRRIAEIAGRLPLVLTGDLNVTENSDAYATLARGSAEVQLKDTRHASENGHFGGTSSFNGFNELVPGRLIDHIFVKAGIRVLENGVLSDRWDGFWASDHLPVLAVIVL
jgi:endonuclease/exonuclease/phosphatase family metal-dependent hydrolase